MVDSDKKFAFSRARLRNLPVPDDGWTYFYDEAVRGLAIAVSSTGLKSFRVCRRFEGSFKRITLGLFGPDIPDTHELPGGAKPLDVLGKRAALNVRMARKVGMAVMAQLDAGINPAEGRHGTLGELFVRYAAYRRDQGKKTVPALVWTWQRYLGKLPDSPRKSHGAKRSKAPGAVNWEHRRLRDVSQEQVSRLSLDLGERVGRTTANRVIELLHAMYVFARKKLKYRGENPAEGTDKFPSKSRTRFLQADETQQFFQSLDQQGDQDFADYIRISLFAGARRKNVLCMRWDELHLDGARWTLPGEVMKTGEALTIPLVDQAIEILRRRSLKTKSEWVFPGGTESGHMGPPRKQWLKLVKALGMPDLRLHDLRRSLGSWMTNTGANTVMTMRALGHRSIDAALVYQRLEMAPVLEAMQRAVSAMSQGKGPKAAVVQMPRKAKVKGRR